MLPGWTSIDTVSHWRNALRLTGVIFLAIGVILELVAFAVKEGTLKRRLELLGIVAFLLLAGAEYFEYEYDDRKDEFNDAEIHHLRLRLKPRALDETEQRALAEELKRSPAHPTVVIFMNDDPESVAFGKSVITSLKLAEMPVFALADASDSPGASLRKGLTIEVVDIHRPPPLAVALFEYFRRKGLEPNLGQTTTRARIEDGFITFRADPKSDN